MSQVAQGRPGRRVRLGVLFGGESPEHDVSVASARQVLKALDPTRFDVRPVEISRAGQWRRLALPRLAAGAELGAEPSCFQAQLEPAILEPSSFELAAPERMGPERSLAGDDPLDCVFVALHGGDGEDGRVQGLLDCLRVPYTGSGVAASSLCMDKVRFKYLVQGAGLPTPPWIEVRQRDWLRDAGATLRQVADRLGFPCFVKSANSGSSLGVFRVQEPEGLESAIDEAFEYDDRLLAEPEIRGREITCAVLGNSGDADVVALPPIEIRPKGSATFFDFEAKYRPGASEEICPAPLDPTMTRRAQDLAIALHELAGCDGMSRADMILDERGELQVLEVNTIPGLTATSLLPQAARAGGLTFSQLVERLIELALRRFERRQAR